MKLNQLACVSGTDACGDTLNFNTPTTTAEGGALSAPVRVDATHVSVTYTPPSGTFEGADTFTYTVSNCGFESAPQSVTLNVVPGPTLMTECLPRSVVLH